MNTRLLPLLACTLGCLSEPEVRLTNPCLDDAGIWTCGADAALPDADFAVEDADVLVEDAASMDAARLDRGTPPPPMDVGVDPDFSLPPPDVAGYDEDDFIDCVTPEGCEIKARFDRVSLFTGDLRGFTNEGGWRTTHSAFNAQLRFISREAPLVDAAFDGARGYYLTTQRLFITDGITLERIENPGASALSQVIPHDGARPWILDAGRRLWRLEGASWVADEGVDAIAQLGLKVWRLSGSRLSVQALEEEAPTPVEAQLGIASPAALEALDSNRALVIGMGLSLVDVRQGVEAAEVTARGHTAALVDGVILSTGEWVGLEASGRLVLLQEGAPATPLELLEPPDDLEIYALRGEAALELATSEGWLRLALDGTLTRQTLPMIDARADEVYALGGLPQATVTIARAEGGSTRPLTVSGLGAPLPEPQPNPDEAEVIIGRPVFCVGSAGAAWRAACAFERGFGFFQGGGWLIPRFQNISVDAPPYRIYERSPSEAYLLADREIIHLKQQDEETWTHPSLGEVVPGRQIWAIDLDYEGRTLLATDQGLRVSETPNLSSTSPLSPPLEPARAKPSINALALDGETLWVGTDYGLYRLDPDGHSRAYVLDDLPRRVVHDLRVHEALGLVIADEAGVAIIDGARVYRAGYPHGLPGQAALQLIESDDGLWVRGSGGLARLSVAAFEAWRRGEAAEGE